MRFIRKTKYFQDIQLVPHRGYLIWYGLLLLAVPDRVIPFAWRLLEKAGRIGPGASVAIGLALFLAGAVRV